MIRYSLIFLHCVIIQKLSRPSNYTFRAIFRFLSKSWQRIAHFSGTWNNVIFYSQHTLLEISFLVFKEKEKLNGLSNEKIYEEMIKFYKF